MKKMYVLLALIFFVAIFGLGLFLGFGLPRLWSFKSKVTVYDTPTLLKQVQSLSQLVTVKYVMEKVVVVEDVKFPATLATSRVLMIAHGTVKAGVDLGELSPKDLRVSEKNIVIVLPPSRVTDAYLDEKQTQVVERTTGVLRAFDKALEQTARQNAVNDMQRAARNNGILRDADERARTQLANLFLQLGFEKVEFRDRLLPSLSAPPG